MRAGYFPLANPLGHLTPPLPKSRSKFLIIGLSIFAVLFLAWGISMTVVYAHHTNTHNTTIVEHEAIFRCSAETGHCSMTYEIREEVNNKDPFMLGFDSMQQCLDSCVKSSVRLDMSAIPASRLQCDAGLTWDSSSKLCVGSPEHPFTFYYEKCPRSTENTPACKNNWKNCGDSCATYDAYCHGAADETQCKKYVCPPPDSHNHYGCTYDTGWGKAGYCSAIRGGCSPGYKKAYCGGAGNANCMCLCDPNYTGTYGYQGDLCKWEPAGQLGPRFYPVSNHNTLLDITAGTGQNPDDVLYCMDPKFVKTWVNIKFDASLVGSDSTMAGHPVVKCPPAPYTPNTPGGPPYNLKKTVSASPGCEYHDGTFAELGECGIWHSTGWEPTLWVYMCVNYVSPAKLPKTYSHTYYKLVPWASTYVGDCDGGGSDFKFMTTAVTTPYHVNYDDKVSDGGAKYEYPVGSSDFKWWAKWVCEAPSVHNNYGCNFKIPAVGSCGQLRDGVPYGNVQNPKDGCSTGYKPVNCGKKGCECICDPNYNINRAVSSVLPYVNGNYFVPSAPAYCTNDGKQPWLNWSPFTPRSTLGEITLCTVYPAQPCLRAHDNQEDCEAPVSGFCQINSAHPDLHVSSHVYGANAWADGTYYKFNECGLYVTQSGCEGSYMGYNDYGTTAGWTPWKMPGTSATMPPCEWVAGPPTHPCVWGINGDGENTISRPCEGDGCYLPCHEEDGIWTCGAGQRQYA